MRSLVRRIASAAAVAGIATACGFAQGGPRGRVEFAVLLTPVSGRPEPARELAIFLLRKPFREIQREAEEKTPQPSLADFIAPLQFSKELKEWMKKHHTVTISGPEFRAVVTTDDVLHIPEFLDAYVASNLSGLNQGFPEPKFSPDDRMNNPKKYEAAMKLYEPKLRKYLTEHADSLEATDTILNQTDPSPAWKALLGHWHELARQNALSAAQTEYLAAKTETNLEGRGAFEAAPGSYALSTLGGEALSGDLHLHWDVPVEIRAGGVTRIELTNLNAEKR